MVELGFNTSLSAFLKFDFVIITLKNHNWAKSRNYMSPK